MSDKLNKILKEGLTPDKLFSATGCLSLETLQKYLEDQLITNQMHAVEKHLLGCELCSDALDGLSIMPDGSKTKKNIADINKEIRAKTTAGKAKIIYFDFKRIAAAAAILILLTGTFYILVNNYFPFNEKELLTDLQEETDEKPPSHGAGSMSTGHRPLPKEGKEEGGKEKMEENKPTKKTPAKEKRDGKVLPEYSGEDLGGAVKDDRLRSEMSLAETATIETADDKAFSKIKKTKKQAGAGKNNEELISFKSSANENDIKNNEGAGGENRNEIAFAEDLAGKVERDGNKQGIAPQADNKDKDAAQNEPVLDQIALVRKSDMNEFKAAPKSKVKVNEKTSKKSGRSMGYNANMPVEEVETEQIFLLVEKQPEFPGGIEKMLEFIAKNLKYPESAKEANIKGKVFVSFVIDKFGFIKDVKVVKSVARELDEEAVRVIKLLPQWIPGERRGKKVAVKLVHPIVFEL
ncbi:MAG: energy transducer TonB [Cytophagales bacterium]|nr:energy transducer TonB [Cytophagales bacterium]